MDKHIRLYKDREVYGKFKLLQSDGTQYCEIVCNTTSIT